MIYTLGEFLRSSLFIGMCITVRHILKWIFLQHDPIHIYRIDNLSLHQIFFRNPNKSLFTHFLWVFMFFNRSLVWKSECIRFYSFFCANNLKSTYEKIINELRVQLPSIHSKYFPSYNFMWKIKIGQFH